MNLPPCDHDNCPPTHCKKDLLVALHNEIEQRNRCEQKSTYCTELLQRAELYIEELTHVNSELVTRIQELEQDKKRLEKQIELLRDVESFARATIRKDISITEYERYYSGLIKSLDAIDKAMSV